jgi:hypothetical protein
MLDIAKDFNQMTVAQSKVSKMPDSTDQDGIDEDKRERTEEDIDILEKNLHTLRMIDYRVLKLEEFILTNTSGDKTLEDLLCRIIDSVDWCKCSK